MYINTSTPAAIATKVWAQASRKLTGFGSMISGPIQTTAGTIAANTSVDLRTPTSTNFRDLSMAISSGGTAYIGLWDGSTSVPGVNINNGNTVFVINSVGNSVGARLVNTDATHATTALYSYVEWVF